MKARFTAAEPADTDDEVMRRIAARDHAAMRRVAEDHAPTVWRIAYRMLGDPVEAEDVAQESMMRLWQTADRWQAGQSGIGAWLYRVTTNLCLDRLRRRRFRSDEAVPDRADEAPLADARMQDDETHAAVKACIEALPERQRAAIILTYYEELTNQMAAGALQMQLKAFESLLFRARGSMRGCIEGHGLAASDAGARG